MAILIGQFIVGISNINWGALRNPCTSARWWNHCKTPSSLYFTHFTTREGGLRERGSAGKNIFVDITPWFAPTPLLSFGKYMAPKQNMICDGMPISCVILYMYVCQGPISAKIMFMDNLVYLDLFVQSGRSEDAKGSFYILILVGGQICADYNADLSKSCQEGELVLAKRKTQTNNPVQGFEI